MNAVELITASQGSQPTFAGVRVGIFQAGEPGGVLTVRLLLRNESENRYVDVVPGGAVDLFGQGVLTVEEIRLGGESGSGRDLVVLAFEPSPTGPAV